LYVMHLNFDFILFDFIFIFIFFGHFWVFGTN